MIHFLTYKASAGSGKTYTLAVEYIKQLLISKEADPHRSILAVTFTKDATGEMKDRIIAELYGLASGLAESQFFLTSVQSALSESGQVMNEATIQSKAKHLLQRILHDYSRFHVGTIDGFFQRVLRNLARELGKGSKFSIELNTKRVIEEAVKEMIEKSNEDKKLLAWISRYIEQKIEMGSSWRIDRELESFGMNIFNEFFQEHEMALRKQFEDNPELIDEMINTHQSLTKRFETKMHGFAKEFFATVEELDIDNTEFGGGGKGGAVMAYFTKLTANTFDDEELLKVGLMKCLELPEKWIKSSTKKDRKQALVQLVETHLFALLSKTETYRLAHIFEYNGSLLLLKNIHQLSLLWDIALKMEALNKENNRFMLSQTALLLNEVIDDSDASFVFEKIGGEIKHVMIDEFQDTSRLQWQNFKSLLSEIISNNNFSMLVGDVKQSIYRWRNGDWNILNNITQEIQTNTKSLDKNYRSKRHIVEFNNSFFVLAGKQLDADVKELFGNEIDTPFTTAYSEVGVVQLPKEEAKEGFVSIDLVLPEEKDDAMLAVLLEKLQQLHDAGVEPTQICILLRDNKGIITVANHLALAKDQYPELAKKHYLDIVSNDAFQLCASQTLKIIIEALRSLADWENPVPRAQLLMMWQESKSTTSIDMHRLLNEDINLLLPEGFRRNDLSQLEIMPLHELILHIYQVFELHNLKNQSAYIYTFLDYLQTYLQQNPSDITAFISYWEEELQQKSIANETGLEGVRAMTIHKSKGLQFHTVIVPFCDWKFDDSKSKIVWCKKKEAPFNLELLPVNHTKRMKNSCFYEEFFEETRQLFMDNLNLAYVAFTRAENNLLLISKKLKEKPNGKSITMPKLLSNVVAHLPGSYNEELSQYQLGKIDAGKEKKSESSNMLKNKKQHNSVQVDFVSEQLRQDKTIFKQSNKSKVFLDTGEAPQENSYIQQGNLMHRLFSIIHTETDIEKAIETLIFEGVINRDQQADYSKKIRKAIKDAAVSDWFSAKYTLFNECVMLYKDSQGQTQTRKPDRVMVSNNEVIVVDYKFGIPKNTHKEQVAAYIHLLQKMGYQEVCGFLWYVNNNTIVQI